MRIENTGFGNIRLIQDPDSFCYGIDAVILADFASGISGRWKSAADLGTGTGIIPFILIHKNPEKSCYVVGIDIQEEAVEMATDSSKMNSMDDRVRFFKADVADIAEAQNSETLKSVTDEPLWRTALESDGFDIAVSNPPYFAKGGGIINRKDSKYIARHETTADLDRFMKAAANILKTRGNFFIVHRPSRLVDIFSSGRKYGLEPKTMRMVIPSEGKAPNIVLVHCVKCGGKELKVMSDLIVYNGDGNYSDEIEEIYERQRPRDIT